jgi:aldehyde:ferredoxin oxidoreductase
MISAKQLQELGFKFDYSVYGEYEVYKLNLDTIEIEVTNIFNPVAQTFELGIEKHYTNLKQLNYHELEQLIKLITYQVKNEIDKL